jgi:hypothetical protein
MSICTKIQIYGWSFKTILSDFAHMQCFCCSPGDNSFGLVFFLSPGRLGGFQLTAKLPRRFLTPDGYGKCRMCRTCARKVWRAQYASKSKHLISWICNHKLDAYTIRCLGATFQTQAEPASMKNAHKGCGPRGGPKATSFREAGFRLVFQMLLPSI